MDLFRCEYRYARPQLFPFCLNPVFINLWRYPKFQKFCFLNKGQYFLRVIINSLKVSQLRSLPVYCMLHASPFFSKVPVSCIKFNIFFGGNIFNSTRVIFSVPNIFCSSTSNKEAFPPLPYIL